MKLAIIFSLVSVVATACIEPEVDTTAEAEVSESETSSELSANGHYCIYAPSQGYASADRESAADMVFCELYGPISGASHLSHGHPVRLKCVAGDYAGVQSLWNTALYYKVRKSALRTDCN